MVTDERTMSQSHDFFSARNGNVDLHGALYRQYSLRGTLFDVPARIYMRE